MKKFIIYALVLIMCAGILAGCSSEPTNALGADGLRIRHTGSGVTMEVKVQEYIDELADAYKSLKFDFSRTSFDLKNGYELLFYSGSKLIAGFAIDDDNLIRLQNDALTYEMEQEGLVTYKQVNKIFSETLSASLGGKK